MMDKGYFSAEKLSFAYTDKQALFHISFDVAKGDFVSIIGPNGSGKSTLFRLLCGQRKPMEGRVFFGDKNVHALSVSEIAQNFAVINQKEENSFSFSCFEMVLLGLHPFRSRFGQPTKAQLAQVYETMTGVGIGHLAQKPVTQISGGEFQRVILARALVQNPKILFLDEAMSGFDVGAKIEIIKYLRSLCKNRGLTVIAINHDLSAAFRYSDKVLALQAGQAVGFGLPHEVMTPLFFEQVFGVKAEIIENKGFFIEDIV